MLASAGEETSIRLWNLATEAEVGALKGHTSHIWTIAFSPNGKMLASAGHDQTIRIWDIK